MSDLDKETARERDDRMAVAPDDRPTSPRGPDAGEAAAPPQGPVGDPTDPRLAAAAPLDDEGARRAPTQRQEDAGNRLQTSDLVDRGSEVTAEGGAEGVADERSEPLLRDGESYVSRWQTIQAGFVDEPQRAVQDADALVAEVMQQLADSFAAERDRLEKQWSGGGDAGTEDLRLALQRYRSFFNRLLYT
jgi:hypothetical protein